MQLYQNDHYYNEISYEPSKWVSARRHSMARMKKVRRRHLIRNGLVIALMILAFCTGFFGRGLLNVHAEEEISPSIDRYYSCIQIKRGDSLWNIAEAYSQNSGYNTREYVDELKRINKLDSEEIHAGEYLTVVYCE